MIQLKNVAIDQGDFKLRDINLHVQSGTYAILMGSTGCGKTTLLEGICGLRSVHQGEILVNGDHVTRSEPAARCIGYVPQDAALFPAMKIGSQIEFGLNIRNVHKIQAQKRVRSLAKLLQIESLLARYPRHLSGGERQRVALARALSFRPKLLCLDEPLASLDEPTRQQLATLLRSVHSAENVTVLHVTHNIDEAKKLGTAHFRMTDSTIVKENFLV